VMIDQHRADGKFGPCRMIRSRHLLSSGASISGMTATTESSVSTTTHDPPRAGAERLQPRTVRDQAGRQDAKPRSGIKTG